MGAENVPVDPISLWTKIRAILGIITSLLSKGHDLGLWTKAGNPIRDVVKLQEHLEDQ